jgi:hypothetical protein
MIDFVEIPSPPGRMNDPCNMNEEPTLCTPDEPLQRIGITYISHGYLYTQLSKLIAPLSGQDQSPDFWRGVKD